MRQYSDSKIVNIGTGIGITIAELAKAVAEVVGYKGEVVFDLTKPDGTPKKINDVSYLQKLGWEAKTDLVDGLRMTYEWYCKHVQ